MTIVINYTNKSGRTTETLTDVKSYKDTSIWSIEVVFNNGKIESFYSIESVKELSEPEVMTKSYDSASNRIETIHPTHISSVPCYTFTFEEWRQENYDAITKYIAEYPDNFTPDMTRYNMEMKLWIKGPGPTGIYNDDIIFRVELEEELFSEPEGRNISEDDFRELLVEKEYEMLKENHPKQYEIASEEEQVEEWVDAMDKQDLQVEANKLGYRVI